MEKQKAQHVRIDDDCNRSEGVSDEMPSDLHPGDYLVVPQFGLIHLAMKVELEFMV